MEEAVTEIPKIFKSTKDKSTMIIDKSFEEKTKEILNSYF